MKIALVSPYDWAVPGGVNSHVTQLAQQFIRSGHDVRVIAPSSRRRSHDCEYLTVIGEHVIGLPASGSVANVCLSFNLGPRVKALLARERFDIIHVHEPFMPLLPFQFLRYADTTLVSTFHATRDGGSRLYAYARFIIEPWWQRIDGRIAVSRAALKMISRYFADRYQIIPNGIDYAHFAAEVPPIPRYIDNKRNILFLGRQEKRKGLPYLLEAYARLKRERPDIRLIVVGPDGGMRAACERYVRQNRLEDVVFTGFVPYEELPRYYKTADVYCAPNTGHESFGIVLLEAMAAGTPIVASNIGGFADVVEDGVEGVLVPPRDADALASAMDRLLSDAALREEMGRAGTVRAAPYAWDKVSGQVLDYYQELAGSGATSANGS
ncbi:MAG: glycosyltransferase family 4 protein [Dehalococcoidia bacterium]|nr:glycosyltransferase family 4 protein [Dehalococcoidia bacterium]